MELKTLCTWAASDIIKSEQPHSNLTMNNISLIFPWASHKTLTQQTAK